VADVLGYVSTLPRPSVENLEAALIPELTEEELRTSGYPLRRVFRFVAARYAGLLADNHGEGFTITGGSTQTTSLPGAGTVKVTGATIPGAQQSKEAYALLFDGPSSEVHWLQFIWRQIVAVYPASGKGGKPREVAIQQRVTVSSGRSYLLTSDRDHPRWTTDGAEKSRPFYEDNSPAKRTATSLQIADDPTPLAHVLKPLLNSAKPPDKGISRFHATAFLVRSMEVLYRADIELEWTITSGRVEPARPIIQVRPATELDAGHRAALAVQFAKFDYFPGPLIGPPVPRDPFEPISIPKDWPTGALERYQSAAKAANAALIEDVEEKGTNPDKDGRVDLVIATTKPKAGGLNYDPPLDPNVGETGYVDHEAKYHNPDMPFDDRLHPPDGRLHPLPKVAIVLGEKAFNLPGAPRPMEYTIAVLRHEMAHASQDQMAKGWLLKWKDELTRKEFPRWLDNQKNIKSITPLDFDLVSGGVSTPPTLAAVEVLAFTEGFVTALPFLTTPPSLSVIVVDVPKWPAAIQELRGAFAKFALLKSDTDKSTRVWKAMTARMRTVICGSLEKARRETLVSWIDVLLDPDSLHPTSPSEKLGLQNLRADFSKAKSMLKEIKNIAQSCKP
jgi:hypothetical protein